jgi:hypothetical protein
MYKALKLTEGIPLLTPNAIFGHRKSKKHGTEYLVQWKETPLSGHTYLAAEKLPTEMVEEYLKDLTELY